MQGQQNRSGAGLAGHAPAPEDVNYSTNCLNTMIGPRAGGRAGSRGNSGLFTQVCPHHRDRIQEVEVADVACETVRRNFTSKHTTADFKLTW